MDMSDDFHTINRVYHLTAGDFSDPVRVWNVFLGVLNRTAGVTLVGTQHHVFTGGGLTGVILLAESHAAIHTWPEHNYASVTFSSCGGKDSIDSFADNLAAAWPFCDVEFVEMDAPGYARVIRTNGLPKRLNTSCQRLETFSSAAFGKVALVDGVTQTTELDAAIYHEALCLTPLAFHGGTGGLNVLVVGGGDGYAVKTVLCDDRVQEVTMIDIDRVAVAVLSDWFGNAGTLSDQRVRVVYDDAGYWLMNDRTTYDVIIIDLTDPTPDSASEPLADPYFYALCSARLKEGGILSQQIGSPWFEQKKQPPMLTALAKTAFRHVQPYHAAAPCFLGGQCLFLLAHNHDLPAPRPFSFATDWYTPSVATASFILPPHIGGLFQQGG